MSDAAILARQYADDTNLRARQRLWEISPADPPLDFNEWSVALTGAGRGDVVLDAGCGNGIPLGLLHERGCTAIGLDRSSGMVRAAHGPALTVGDVQCLPFATGTFDAAVALMMLYHVPDQRAAADYVASSADHFERTLPPRRRWGDVVETVRTAVADAVAANGALIVTARLGAFVCH